jgi:hypothetical protein
MTFLQSVKSTPRAAALLGVARVASMPSILTRRALASRPQLRAKALRSYCVSSQTETIRRRAFEIRPQEMGPGGPNVNTYTSVSPRAAAACGGTASKVFRGISSIDRSQNFSGLTVNKMEAPRRRASPASWAARSTDSSQQSIQTRCSGWSRTETSKIVRAREV